MAQKYYGTKLIEAWKQSKDGNEGYAGYGVKCEDGYTSWSPKDVFEKAYQPITAMSFGHATEVMRAGQKVCRSGWNGKDMWLRIQVPDENSKMTQPYIYMKTSQGDLIPYPISAWDVLANDWQIVE